MSMAGYGGGKKRWHKQIVQTDLNQDPHYHKKTKKNKKKLKGEKKCMSWLVRKTNKKEEIR